MRPRAACVTEGHKSPVSLPPVAGPAQRGGREHNPSGAALSLTLCVLLNKRETLTKTVKPKTASPLSHTHAQFTKYYPCIASVSKYFAFSHRSNQNHVQIPNLIYTSVHHPTLQTKPARH